MAETPKTTGGIGSEATQFKPGNPGRPAGIPNKLSKSVRETVLEVFNKLQEEGGPAALSNWAEQEPTEFYRIAAKLIPTEVKASIETEKAVVKLVFPDGD